MVVTTRGGQQGDPKASGFCLKRVVGLSFFEAEAKPRVFSFCFWKCRPGFLVGLFVVRCPVPAVHVPGSK